MPVISECFHESELISRRAADKPFQGDRLRECIGESQGLASKLVGIVLGIEKKYRARNLLRMKSGAQLKDLMLVEFDVVCAEAEHDRFEKVGPAHHG